MPRRKSFIISLFILVASLGVLLALIKSPLASVFYPNVLAHSFTLLAITAVVFFACFFSYQLYAKEKDIRYYIVSLSFYVLGVFGFIHSVMVPAFGWGNEALFDISEHYGMFLASFLLLGLIFSFTGTAQEKIFQLRTKIFLGVNFFIVTAVALLFLSPGLSVTLSHNVNFFIGLTGVYFLFLLLVLLARQENDFFTTSLPKVLALLVAAATSPLLYQEWNVVWWYYHFLWLAALLLLLLLLRAKKGKNITEILFSSFSIRTRLFFVVGLTLVAIVANGLIDFRLSQNHLQVQTLENLVLMADMQEGQILTYLDKLKGRTTDFASDGFIREGLKKILAGDKEAVNDLSRHLSENKLPLDQGVFGIHVMDLNGKVVASSQGNEIGKEDMAMNDVFVQAKGSRYANAFVSDIVEDFHFGERNIAIMATAPIVDQTRKENIGVIMLFFKTQALSDILTGKSQNQFGALSTWTSRKKTMEMYLVNKDKLMVSESKSIMNAALKEKVDTPPVRLCDKSEEMSGEYLNYQGVSVFGASMCFANGWTLLTEINKDEALATLGDYLQQNLLSASAAFLIILIVMYLFTIGIISPLKELSEAAQKIGHGDFTARAKLMTNDEFGQLSQVFNEMVENIQKSRTDLQQKVKEEETSRSAIANILADLEESKTRLEQAKARNEAILASIGDGLVVTDKDGQILLTNKTFEKLLGRKEQDVQGKLLFEIIPMTDKEGKNIPETERLVTKAIKERLIVTATKNYKRKDGTIFPAYITVSPIIIGNDLIGAVEVFRDITHEYEIDKAKTEFVSLASHQLRTPLSTINWYTEMLLSGDAGQVNENQKKYLEEAYRASKRMVDLVNSLLNVSRLEMGTFIVEPEPTDMLVLARSVTDELKPLIDQKKILFKLSHEDNLPKIQADPKLLRMVLQNLLSNSIKYTPEKGKVKMDFRLVKSGEKIGNQLIPADSLLCAVSDTGYGIPKAQQDKIFTKLFRADNVREKDAEGTGLGLYIVKSIIDHSSGMIWFESEQDKGTTFYVTLPLEGMKKKEGTKVLS